MQTTKTSDGPSIDFARQKSDQTMLIGVSTTAGDSTTAGAPFIALTFLL